MPGSRPSAAGTFDVCLRNGRGQRRVFEMCSGFGCEECYDFTDAAASNHIVAFEAEALTVMAAVSARQPR